MSTMNELKVRVGERLAKERTRLRRTQKEMAALGEVGDRSYWHYEKGERSPDSEFLANIARAGADILYIVTGKVDAAGLASDESALVSGYRGMDERGKAMVLAMIGGYTQPPAGTLSISGGTIGQVVQGDAAGGGTVVVQPDPGASKKRR